VIYAGVMWRELRDFFVFEDIGKLSVFERDRSRGSGGCGCRGNIVGIVEIQVNRGGEGFLVASDIGNCEKKEFVALWIDLTGRKDSRETTFWLRIRRIRRIW